MDLRSDLNEWHLHIKGENKWHRLSRFLIAMDELRARLAPSKYPNLEISDEGNLWFNIDTSTGTAEVFAIPFGFELITSPSILVSFPRKAEKVNMRFLRRLDRISKNNKLAELFAGFSTKEETLDAYRKGHQPSLSCTRDLQKITQMKKQNVFFSYLGLHFPVIDQTVFEVESMIRNILVMLES